MLEVQTEVPPPHPPLVSQFIFVSATRNVLFLSLFIEEVLKQWFVFLRIVRLKSSVYFHLFVVVSLKLGQLQQAALEPENRRSPSQTVIDQVSHAAAGKDSLYNPLYRMSFISNQSRGHGCEAWTVSKRKDTNKAGI